MMQMRSPLLFRFNEKEMGALIKRLHITAARLEVRLQRTVEAFGDVMTECIRFYTPRDTGETQASIGRYNPALIDVAKADPGAMERAKLNAVFKVMKHARTYSVIVGSNLDRVTYLNYGWRYRGDNGSHEGYFMFERGQTMATLEFAPMVEATIIGTIQRPEGNDDVKVLRRASTVYGRISPRPTRRSLRISPA